MKVRVETNFSGELYLKFLKKLSPKNKFQDGGYNQIENNFKNFESSLFKEKFDYIICQLSIDFFKDLSAFKNPYSFRYENLTLELEEKFKFLFENFDHFEKNSTSIIFLNLSNEINSHYGYLETNTENYSINKIINKINDQLSFYANKIKNFYVFDFNQLVHKCGYNNIFDKRLDYYYAHPFSLNGCEHISNNIIKFLNSIDKIQKKVICLDLDNTLWGGVIGENSSDEIELSNEGLGKIYKDFQRQLLNLKNRGIILTICSKNNYDDAKKFIKNNKNMELQWDDFVIKKINWKNKDQNLLEIANELNLGLDSFIFIDDNVHERTLIKQSIPEIEVLDFPEEIADLSEVLLNIESLKTFKITNEDLKKTDQYVSEFSRNKLKSHMNFKDFLKSLKLECKIEKLNEKNLNRFCQLIKKVNQFNLTNIRYSEAEVVKMKSEKQNKMFTVKVEDKFGDFGIISVIILKILKKEIHIDTLLMSCRAIGKEIEDYIINFTIDYRNKFFPDHELVGIFSESKKNKDLVSNFYEKNQFIPLNKKKGCNFFVCKNYKVNYPNHIIQKPYLENFK